MVLSIIPTQRFRAFGRRLSDDVLRGYSRISCRSSFGQKPRVVYCSSSDSPPLFGEGGKWHSFRQAVSRCHLQAMRTRLQNGLRLVLHQVHIPAHPPGLRRNLVSLRRETGDRNSRFDRAAAGRLHPPNRAAAASKNPVVLRCKLGAAGHHLLRFRNGKRKEGGSLAVRVSAHPCTTHDDVCSRERRTSTPFKELRDLAIRLHANNA